MKKSELVELVAEKSGLSKAAADRAIGAFTEVVSDALVKGDKVTLVGFGTFSTGRREAREGRNPLTGETLKIAASTTVKFKAGATLKEAVNK